MPALTAIILFALMACHMVALPSTAQDSWPEFCTKDSPSDCGSICHFTCPQFPNLTVPMYVFSAKETTGECRRENMEYQGKPTALVENSGTLEKCQCLDFECDACMTDKHAADVESCCGTTKFYVYHNLRIPIRDPNAPPKKETCCRAEGVDSSGDVSSVCFCEASTTECFNTPPTTPLPPPLCPPLVTPRIIGGDVVEPCPGSGIARLAAKGEVVCNGVVVNNPEGLNSTGAKLEKPVIYMPSTCTEGIDILLSTDDNGLTLTIGNDTLPYKKEDISRLPLKNKFFEALDPKSYNGSCWDPMCVYNPETMSAAINTSHCFLISYGADSIDDQKIPETSGNLNKLEVKLKGDGSGCMDAMGENATCFEPLNPKAFSCVGDLGAPVFCSLSTGESVLYGLFGDTANCGGPGNDTFPVVPIN